MITIVFTPTSKDAEDAGDQPLAVEAPTFIEAATMLLTEINKSYPGIDSSQWQPIFEGLAKLAAGEKEYSEWDFSVPEDAFHLKLEVTQ